MAKPDFRRWDLIEVFSFADASYLWINQRPEADNKVTKSGRANEVLRALQAHAQIKGWSPSPPTLADTVSRQQLIAIANEWREKPPFLFSEERDLIDPRAVGGSRRKFDPCLQNFINLVEQEIWKKSKGELSITSGNFKFYMNSLTFLPGVKLGRRPSPHPGVPGCEVVKIDGNRLYYDGDGEHGSETRSKSLASLRLYFKRARIENGRLAQ